MNRKHLRKFSFTVLFAALNFIAFTYLKISIPVAGGGAVAIHIANAIVVLSAWLIGPVPGGIAGAIGLSIADVLDPLYIVSAPKTFFLKFMIGFIAGTIGNRMGLQETNDASKIRRITIISASAALVFNVIFEPIISFLYRRFLLGVSAEAASILAAWLGGVTAVNAVICVIVSVLLYKALYRFYRQLDQ
jgi:uncharacterized membrane protein